MHLLINSIGVFIYEFREKESAFFKDVIQNLFKFLGFQGMVLYRMHQS